MKEQLISFKTAKLAKEKGFDVECLNFYTKPRSKMFGIDEHGRNYPSTNKSKKLYSIGKDATLHIENVMFAPTQSLLQKWLREVHNIHIEIKISNLGRYYWAYNEFNMENISNVTFWRRQDVSSEKVPTYEEALGKGLQEALKLIK
jgi:hypothetical protein